MEVKIEHMTAVRNAIGGIHQRLAKMGAKLDAKFRADEVYPREDVMESISSLVRTCENTLNAMEKSVDDSATERERLAKEAAQVPGLEKIAEGALAQLEAIAKSR